MLMVGEVLWMNDGGWGRNPERRGQAEVFCAKLYLTLESHRQKVLPGPVETKALGNFCMSSIEAKCEGIKVSTILRKRCPYRRRFIGLLTVDWAEGDRLESGCSITE